ncbi:helix-turn-helix domain-containing protein [Actinopolymorpha pittospori]|uniref:Excisionase family DNA binding protein n=1 Tax=Actinopolymorpha pittospori TaxID=648752 RepID=A0A927N4Q9_9ACTN|nr:helix-turn-helix domain-containing protein [Actinopolymorpha pittospori]MBE1612069.1 excisionase family DNA binding protein [Actinopolymorpha pittospori]
MDAVPTLYTTEEAAKVLRVRRSWLERQAAARRIPFTMLGGCYRFTADHLAQIVHIFESTPTVTDLLARSSPQPTPRTRRRTTDGTTGSTPPLRARPRTQRMVA